MIEFKNVIKRFGSRAVLRGIDFAVKRGEIFFLLGTSGTGKSVALKCVVGLLRPDEGSVIVDGVDVSRLSEDSLLEVRRTCGMVFQHPALFDSLTIFDNVAYGLRQNSAWTESQIRERVIDCLRLVHLSPEILGRRPAQISYGMQKRVSLARAVAPGPRILLFDEPTTGLDPITTNAINRLIQELSRELQTTSIIVSHDMHCALDIADRILVLDEGRVVDVGTPEQMAKSQHPLIQDFLKEALQSVQSPH
jgi:phospholipid/cholesterol/gamma-HCH transport system ATP-binding protein